MFGCYSPDGNLETWGVTMEHKPEQEPDRKLNYTSDKPKVSMAIKKLPKNWSRCYNKNCESAPVVLFKVKPSSNKQKLVIRHSEHPPSSQRGGENTALRSAAHAGT